MRLLRVRILDWVWPTRRGARLALRSARGEARLRNCRVRLLAVKRQVAEGDINSVPAPQPSWNYSGSPSFVSVGWGSVRRRLGCLADCSTPLCRYITLLIFL
jgi:hypothetical protein